MIDRSLISTWILKISSTTIDFYCNFTIRSSHFIYIFRFIIKLTKEQISNFAANSLEVENKNGAKLLIISTRGWDALTVEQQVNILFCKNTPIYCKKKILFFLSKTQ